MVRTWGCDVNVRWESDDRVTFGPAPLHTAVRHGAIECVYCLLSYHADLNLVRSELSFSYRNYSIIISFSLTHSIFLHNQDTYRLNEPISLFTVAKIVFLKHLMLQSLQ